jgi:hypothetical protein
MDRVPGVLIVWPSNDARGVLPFAHHLAIECLDRRALGAEVGAPIGLTEGCDGGVLSPQRHSHLPRLRVLDEPFERPKTPAGHDLRADSPELVPPSEAAVCLNTSFNRSLMALHLLDLHLWVPACGVVNY